MNEPALVGYRPNPLLGVRQADMRFARLGLSIRELAALLPPYDGPLVCALNGQYILRADWGLIPGVDDVVIFSSYPEKAGVLQTILGVIIVAVSAYFDFTPGVQFGASLIIGGLINLLVPVRGSQAPAQSSLSVFSTSLAGNAARLDQPIWKNCGRIKITPPFACNPYITYLPINPADPYVDCDQYYYAIFALGEGQQDIEQSLIGKTQLSHFADVQRAAYLAPGVLPSVVLANIVSSQEVSTPLELKKGRHVGGYAACRPLDQCTAIGIDVVAPQGLGKTDSKGNAQNATVIWQVQARPIDDFGTALGNWTTIATETRAMSTTTEQRWSALYPFSSPYRPEVRVARTDNFQAGDSTARDSISWTGLRGLLTRPAPLNANTAHFEVVMRSGSQLSAQSSRDFSCIVRGYARTWSPGGGWTAPIFTRNAAWWLADLWTNPVWGEGLDDSRIDLQGLYDWSLTLDARQDHFDYSFTTATSSWDAAQMIARSGRARVSRRNGVYAVTRDEAVVTPVAALTPRTTQPKSMVLHAQLPQLEQPDGVIVEYLDLTSWDSVQLECPCPGVSATAATDPLYDVGLPAMANPIYVQLEGITGQHQARREGLYHAADMSLRRTTVSAAVEMEGMVLAFLDPLRWLPQINGYGQAGDVVAWDAATLLMTLSEPADFSGGQPLLTLQRDDMTLTAPALVTPGPTPTQVRLPEAPDFPLFLDNADRERPKYLLGLATGDELVKVVSISDGGVAQGGAHLAKIEALVDDPRVHTRDNAFLPGPGDVQDPTDDGINSSNVAFSALVNIDAIRNKGQDHSSGGIDYSGSAMGVTISGLNPDWSLALTLPAGQFYQGWSEWASDTDPFVTNVGLAWGNSFSATSDLGTGEENFGAMSIAATGEAARAAFSGGTLTGSTSWTFWFNSDHIDDNRGGLSILVTKA